MALLGTVEAKSWRGRSIHGFLVLMLMLGGLTMVYPFAVMLSGSVRSELDESDLDLVPGFWTDDDMLLRKFLETKYNQDIDALNRAHGQRYFSFRDIEPVDRKAGDKAARELTAWWEAEPLPDHWQVLGGVSGVRTVPENLRELRHRLRDHFDGDLEAVGRDLGTPVPSWHTLVLPTPDWISPRYDYADHEIYRQYTLMLNEAPRAERRLVSLTGHFLQSTIYPAFGRGDTSNYNQAHVAVINNFGDFRLPDRVPTEDQPTLRKEWIDFVTQELNPSFVTVEGVTASQYDIFRRDTLGRRDTQPLPDGTVWLRGETRQDYLQFLETLPPERLRLAGPEFSFGAAQIYDAMRALEQDYVQQHSASLRWAYSLRNYINVFDELIVQGRVLVNTVIFCVLAIVLALLVNPMAAYSMSRYKLRSTYKILLFLMATMAFPPMVTLIPQFILLRNLDLLNTFFALVLPLVANGYMIFLLKGFFDSLPPELYEAARIDGASEIRMFFQITMALSKPILAVLALGTFTGAYMMFLYPLLVAPDQDMWLISVWLFQYQQRASSSGVYASVVIASIPTLVIFLFAQRTIMRGIVVPTEK